MPPDESRQSRGPEGQPRPERPEVGGVLRLVRQRVALLSMLRPVGWLVVGVTAAGMLLSTSAPALQAAGVGWLIANVALLADGAAPPGAVAWPLALLTGVVMYESVAGALFVPVHQWIAVRVNGDVRARVRVALGSPTGIGHLEEQDARDLATLPVGADGLFTVGLGVVGQLWLVTRYVGAAAAVALVAAWSWPLAMFGFSLALVSRAIMLRSVVRRAVSGMDAIAPRLRETEYWTAVAGAEGAKEIRLFGFVDEAVDRVRSGHAAFAEMMEHLARRLLGRGWIYGLFPAIGAGVPLAFVARDAFAGQLSPAALATLLGAIVAIQNMSFGGMEALSIETATTQLAALKRLESITPGVSAERAAGDTSRLAPHIRFEGVDFTYPGTERKVFDGLDLEIPPGESIAIVGANGVGKTTLVKLLAGFYRPDAGRITADGVDIADIDPATWWAELAVILQSFVRFHLSALDNVTLADLRHPEREMSAGRAAAAAGATDVIGRLPWGWETILARDYAHGAELSGGQWQRVALTRALYAAEVGGRVLILDEPTAHLDVHAELAIFGQLLTHAPGATRIVISHRYSTVRQASRIVVLADGRVIEDGSHHELMEQGGEYARLYTLQAQAFADTADTPTGAGAT